MNMKRTMRGITYFALVLFLALCSAGCGKAEEEQQSAQSKQQTSKDADADKEQKEKKKKEETEKKEEEPEEKEEEPEESLTPFEEHGALSVEGTQLVDKNKDPYQLKGVSIFFLQYANIDAFRTMKEEWGINMVRLPMYTAGYDGYCTSDESGRAALKQTIYDGIEAATELGLYVIVDWHVLHEEDPNVYLNESMAFFKETTEKYAGYENVLYEICNEPNGNVSWDMVKSYANQVLPVIRERDDDAVIIIGTPTWSQDVDKAAADPVTGYDNLMYALHFYAETHRDDLRQRMINAIQQGLPVFVSEFGISDASGNGLINKEEGNKWMDVINEYGLSFSIWSLSNKDESSAILLPTTTALSDWSYDELTESGKWFLDVMGAQENVSGKEKAAEAGADASSAAQNSSDTGKSSGSKVSSKDGALQANVQATNTWEANGKKCTQYSVEIKNTGSARADSWTCEIEFGQDFRLSQSWCGAYKTSGNRLTITPESYNAAIDAGSVVKDIGFIVESDKDVSVTSISCK